MLHIGLKIKEMVNQEKLDIAAVAEKLGKTPQAVYDMFNKEDLNTRLLRQFAEILKVPMAVLVSEDEQISIDYKNIEDANNEIDRLKKELLSLKSKCVNNATTKVVVELELNQDEFVRLGLKDKIVQVLNKS